MLQFLKVLLGITIGIIGSLALLVIGEIVITLIPVWVTCTVGIVAVTTPFILLIVAERLRINSYKKLKGIR